MSINRRILTGAVIALSLLIASPILMASAGCPGDIDGDGQIGTSDLLALLAAWGPNPGHPADIDGDGTVGTSDLLALLAAWGNCP